MELKKHRFVKKDLWDGPRTLAGFIYPFLVKFRKQYDKTQNIGFRCLHDDAIINRLSEHERQEHDKECYRQWLADLDTMIFAFEHYYKDLDICGPAMKECRNECKRFLIAYKKELAELKKLEEDEYKDKSREYYTAHVLNREAELTQHIWEKYRPTLQEHSDRVVEGLRLFGENFRSLWS